MISAYESGDNNRFQEVLRWPLLRSMDNEYLRLMKTLQSHSEGNHAIAAETAGADDDGDDDDDLK
ncbi:unnamed protein product [Gongylonema pulchrum]|uniref:Uncharacterized protein n=1 Tax=Gongylonema pulchrum TaxID=637853 RepID=A0A3P7PBT5_9BILA|nr:unnamed protein product [Gongylonema pulchrum]